VEKLIIRGGASLQGEVAVNAAKNATLPIIAASLLAEGTTVLPDTPRLHDVATVLSLLDGLGAQCEHRQDGTLTINAERVRTHEAPYHPVRQIRASFLAMGPLLARLGRARMPLPGGCAIGTRPIDLHLRGLAALGAQVSLVHGYVEANAPRLVGNRIYLDYPSVGATENLLMAASLAEGTSIIENAAEEPEVSDLAHFLNAMGAKITGIGSRVLVVQGTKRLRAVEYRVIPDRIEAGTLMIAAAITGGEVTVRRVKPAHLKAVVAKLREAGIDVREGRDRIRVIGRARPRPVNIKTLPYPGFPTDLQAQMMSLLALGQGTSVVTETVFDNRFMHVPELNRMGANIATEGAVAVIRGVERMQSASVRVTDLRAGAALILAALAAEGSSEIQGIKHVDRGYVDLEARLSSLGADVRRVAG
jgi:UDP-N-acetylglucosamine 1-carboxyvinyltransferase